MKCDHFTGVVIVDLKESSIIFAKGLYIVDSSYFVINYFFFFFISIVASLLLSTIFLNSTNTKYLFSPIS